MYSLDAVRLLIKEEREETLMKNQPIKLGNSAAIERVVSENDLIKMAEITGDYNPIHIDEEYAKQTRYGKRIAHGLFCEGMISALLGNVFPGEGTIILSENFRFLYPVFLYDTITAEVRGGEKLCEKQKMMMDVRCFNQDNRTVLEGTVLVKNPNL